MRELPTQLLDEAPLVKLLFLWLAEQGELQISAREVGEELGLATFSTWRGMRRLQAIGLLEEIESPKGNTPGRYRIKGSDDLRKRGRPRLPEYLKNEYPATKLIYLWTRGRKRRPTVRQLAQEIGLATRTVQKGLTTLRKTP
jgi:biotin operon repressor